MALPRRPLFPGGLMPITVSNEKLIQELIQLKKGGCVALRLASCLPALRHGRLQHCVVRKSLVQSQSLKLNIVQSQPALERSAWIRDPDDTLTETSPMSAHNYGSQLTGPC